MRFILLSVCLAVCGALTLAAPEASAQCLGCYYPAAAYSSTDLAANYHYGYSSTDAARSYQYGYSSRDAALNYQYGYSSTDAAVNYHYPAYTGSCAPPAYYPVYGSYNGTRGCNCR